MAMFVLGDYNSLRTRTIILLPYDSWDLNLVNRNKNVIPIIFVLKSHFDSH